MRSFSGATARQIDHYVIPTLAAEKPDCVIIHVGSNEATRDNFRQVDINKVAKTNNKYRETL